MRQSKWIIRECELNDQSLLKNESVFALANGNIGVRGNFEEGYQKSVRGAYINGCFDTEKICYDEKFHGFPEYKQAIVNVQDFQTVYLWAEDEMFSLFSGRVLHYERILDMQNGVCIRRIKWESPNGKRLQINITRMVSLTVKELFTVDYHVTSLNFNGELRFVSECNADVTNYSDSDDPRTSSRKDKSIKLVGADYVDEIAYIETETAHSGICVGTSFCHTLSGRSHVQYEISGETSRVTSSVHTKLGEEVRFVKYVHCVMSQYSGAAKKTAFAFSRRDVGIIDSLYDDQRRFLDKRWCTADVTINADDASDISLRYGIYQMICHSAQNAGSIPAKGLTGEGYAGHYFWDTEIFIQPFFTLTNPSDAKKLLQYRYRCLEEAKHNARLLGHATGAAYPWRTISGSECSTFFPGGAAQYHINADIVYALISYCETTGDSAFLLNEGAEIVFETARLWMELGHFYKDSFRIDTVTGPDEYTCLVNNNYFTNLMAKHNLEWAVKIYGLLKAKGNTNVINGIGLTPDEIEAFRRAYESMYLPNDSELGITPQDDAFLSKKYWDFEATPEEKYPLLLHVHPMTLYRYQVCKQADVLLAYYLFQKQHSRELMQRSYAYYEKITSHDSSLSACIFSIMAARLGTTEKAYTYFMSTIRLDIDDTHGNTKDGLHMANLGGSYLCVLGGFAGLIIDEDGVSLSPVLPGKWRAYSFRFAYQGSVFEVSVTAEKTLVTRISGEAQQITVNGMAGFY